MSFYHRRAVGFFEPQSLVIGRRLTVVRPLDPAIVEPLTKELPAIAQADDGRRPMWWEADGYLVVEHISPVRHLGERIAFVRAVMDRTGCDAVDVHGSHVRAAPWRRS